jgi:hypothetical protein
MPAFCVDEGVSRELARERARVLSDVRYQISVRLEPHATRMPGRVAIEFSLANVIDPVVLDFRGDGGAQGMKVNGSAEEIQKSNGHILISGRRLRRGQNRVELDFDSGIAEANRAVTRYVDTTDGSEYLYTLFVPMDASLAFPCFDQPDLKARFTLSVDAPADWVVVSNTPMSSQSRKDSGSAYRGSDLPPSHNKACTWTPRPSSRHHCPELVRIFRQARIAPFCVRHRFEVKCGMFERYTYKARRAIFFARYEASQFGWSQIEAEFLLLGVFREDKALANQFLASHTKLKDLRHSITQHVKTGPKIATSVDLPLSHECQQVLAYAAEESERMNRRHLGTAHLLLGLLREEKSFAAQLLREQGLTLSLVRAQVLQSE